MTKYKVREVYTPDNIELDRSRTTKFFDSDEPGIYEIAFEAQKLLNTVDGELSEETIKNIEIEFQYQNLQSQLHSQDPNEFTYMLQRPNGVHDVIVTAVTVVVYDKYKELIVRKGDSDLYRKPLPDGSQIYLYSNSGSFWSDTTHYGKLVAGTIVADSLDAWTGCKIRVPC